MKELSITETRNKILSLPGELDETDVVKVTKRGKHVLTILPADLYETIVETLDIMSDPKLMKTLQASLKQIKADKTQSLQDVRRELGI
ncbi:MAG: type II toxin-antitoxin system Phd/YefM family antitoxin [Thermodesulfobacteriota bacterium]|nr:type II toxin-antitoxin system Phd/YefM family antitoxin [Thermodesulfobacteriota bacterium]